MRRREEDRAEKAGQGWPDAALKSLDKEIERIRKIADIIEYEPSDVLWEIIPREARLTELERGATTEWDVFVSHASEDKEGFVRPLAGALRARGLSVWYDEFTLKVGDSLRRSIDRGLARSNYGVVVISPDFLRKEWPQKELDGLVAREVDGKKVILPVWHNISAEQIREYSPMLADRVATLSSKGLDRVIDDLMEAICAGQQNDKGVADQVTQAAPQADVRVTLRGTGTSARFMVENLGPEVAYDVDFAIEPKEDKPNPLIENDCDDKLPAEVLRSGARVELLAALTHRTGVTFMGLWTWREENGQTYQRREKISLQSY